MADFEKVAMLIISHAGEGKYKVRAAVEAFGNGNDEEFLKLMKEAEQEFKKAHKAQIEYLQDLVVSEDTNTPILIVHAMDILMCAMSEQEIVMALITAVNKRSG